MVCMRLILYYLSWDAWAVYCQSHNIISLNSFIIVVKFGKYNTIILSSPQLIYNQFHFDINICISSGDELSTKLLLSLTYRKPEGSNQHIFLHTEKMCREILCHFSLQCFSGQQRKCREILSEIVLCVNIVFLYERFSAQPFTTVFAWYIPWKCWGGVTS